MALMKTDTLWSNPEGVSLRFCCEVESLFLPEAVYGVIGHGWPQYTREIGMDIVRSIFFTIGRSIARAWNYWLADIRKRPSFAGKAASIGIGLFVLCCACSFGLGAVRSTGQAIGMVATNTPKPAATNTPIPTNTPKPTNTPEATNTAQPTSTPLPTNTPEATNTPLPTEPPAPTEPPPPTAVPQASLGVSRDKAEQTYTEFGFAFQNAPLNDGRERRMAMADNKLSNIELVGIAAELSEISVMVAPTTDATQNTVSSLYMFTAINLAVPKWANGPTWLTDNISELVKDMQKGETTGERTIIAKGRVIKLSFVDIAGSKLLFLNIKRAVT
jgi:hypothetical protein